MITDVYETWRTNAQRQGILIGRDEGILIGRDEGIQIGRDEGIQIGEARGIQIGEARGGLKMLFALVRAGLLQLGDAAKQAGMTEAEFRARMVEHETSQDS